MDLMNKRSTDVLFKVSLSHLHDILLLCTVAYPNIQSKLVLLLNEIYIDHLIIILISIFH